MPAVDSQAIAAAVGKGMYAKDRAAQALGITLLEIRPGYARMSMAVRGDMLNGHGTCHGGLIFTLADTAFAYACNSGNNATVAQNCTITFLASPREGDVLTATAQERQRGRRTGFTDIDIADQTGKLVAVFRGHSYQVNGTVVPNIGTIDQ
jgi:acyl-CoA thioesterase